MSRRIPNKFRSSLVRTEPVLDKGDGYIKYVVRTDDGLLETGVAYKPNASIKTRLREDEDGVETLHQVMYRWY